MARLDSAPMLKRLASSLLFGALTMCFAACGGKVVIDSPESGVGGTGGQGGLGLSSSNSSVSSSSASSSGEPSPCDGTKSCAQCVNCTVGLVCAEEWKQCGSFQPCMDLVYCLANCQDQQGCIDKCLAVYPEGIELYAATAQCVVCQACFNDCEGLTKNCP
jgi:hypothetical protein